MAEIRLACYSGPWGPHGLIDAISNISDAGYEGLECPASVVQKYEDRLHVFEEILETSKLKLAGLMQPVNLLDGEHSDEQVERAVNAARFASAAGAPTLTISHEGPGHGPLNDDQWSTFCAIIEEIGERCANFGIEVCLMPKASHLTECTRDLKRLMASTNPKFVRLVIDTAEIVMAEGCPQRAIKAHLDRLRGIRYHDASASKRRQKGGHLDKPGSTPLFGRGAVDFEAVSRLLLSEGYTGWIVLDVTGEAQSPLDAIVNGYRFLMRKSGLFSF